MDTKNALQILEQLRQMPNVPGQTRQSLIMLCDVLNNADAYTPNEVHLANASLFALEQVLAGEFEQLGELYFNEGASWVQAPREKKVMRRSKVMLRSVEPDKFAKVAVVNAIRYLAGVSLKVALDIAVNVNLGSVEEIEAEYDDESAAVLKRHGIEVIRAY